MISLWLKLKQTITNILAREIEILDIRDEDNQYINYNEF